jgi:hypothetical protein
MKKNPKGELDLKNSSLLRSRTSVRLYPLINQFLSSSGESHPPSLNIGTVNKIKIDADNGI